MTDEQRLYMGIYRTYLVVQRDHTLPPKLHAQVVEFIHGNLIEAGRAWRAAGATNTNILDARSKIWGMVQRESLPTTE